MINYQLSIINHQYTRFDFPDEQQLSVSSEPWQSRGENNQHLCNCHQGNRSESTLNNFTQINLHSEIQE